MAKSVLLITFFLLQAMIPFAMEISIPSEVLDEAINVQNVMPIDDGDGHDWANSLIDFDGLEQAEVREESALDLWHTQILVNNPAETPGNPDFNMIGREKVSMCWSTAEGKIRAAGL